MKKIKSEHDHMASTSKWICMPKVGPKPWASSMALPYVGLQLSLEVPVLSTAKTVEVPDGRQILTNQSSSNNSS